MALTLTGCASLEKRLIEASVSKAVVEADVNLPGRPAECEGRTKEEHAPLVVGGEVRTALKSERKALERQQQRQDRCESFYDDVWSKY
ncbi:hypothetical protein [Shinella zoogloeoides]|uniref:hypothetical protein n=1 Tax=Shinella zoogloeoides TaxID=352475 RepID=UPI00273EC164|nr:hypothetical protein [Shinella zoogloeoides]WLR91020.1 hypothetical protein Q9316_00295 [Shinella zoogloeoides]